MSLINTLPHLINTLPHLNPAMLLAMQQQQQPKVSIKTPVKARDQKTPAPANPQQAIGSQTSVQVSNSQGKGAQTTPVNAQTQIVDEAKKTEQAVKNSEIVQKQEIQPMEQQQKPSTLHKFINISHIALEASSLFLATVTASTPDEKVPYLDAILPGGSPMTMKEMANGLLSISALGMGADFLLHAALRKQKSQKIACFLAGAVMIAAGCGLMITKHDSTLGIRMATLSFRKAFTI